jgi:hypothetical protein
MADTNETIADIIAEMRGMGNYQRYSGDHARVLANRLEAAHRRERGDCAKLREAVKAVVEVGYPHNFRYEAPHIRGYCYGITKAIKKCFDALATEKEGGAK